MTETDGRTDVGEQIRQLVRGAQEHWWLVLLCIAAGTGGAWLYSELTTPIYESSARVVVQPAELNTTLIGVPGAIDPARERGTDIQLARSPIVAERARERRSVKKRGGSLVKSLRIEADDESNVITITARSANPRSAAAMAQAVAEEYIDFRKETKRRRFRTALTAVRARIRDLASASPRGAELRRLRGQARELRLLGAVQTGAVEIVEDARPSAVPVEPDTARNIALGAVFGALLGAALAFLRERLDRRIKTVERVEQLLPNLPILAFISKTRKSESSKRVAEEGFHTLRASLQLLGENSAPRSILITSATGGEGKSSTTANLAVAAVEHGQSVLILEADLRRPGLSRGLGIGPDVGMSNVLAGTKKLKECIGLAHFSFSAEGDGPTFVLDGEVPMVAAGPAPEQPRRLFTDHATDRLLSEALDGRDIVLIDGAPLGMFSDMAPVASRVDAVILMVRVGHTREDALERLMDRFTTLGITPIGMVVIEAARDPMPYDSYYDY